MNKLSKLIDIVKKLRAPNGCDWDKVQTHDSLIPYLLEETYEVIEAIEKNNYNSLKEELGDLLLHIVFQAELLAENSSYSIDDSIDNIVNKLISRHPHVFNSDTTKDGTKEEWELTKQKEKNRKSVLEGVPVTLPALLRARRIQEKAADIGFDWNNKQQVIDKIDEEVQELKDAIIKNKGINEELGDVLFTIVNLSRHLNIDPERSLRDSIDKFSQRFKKIENDLNSKKINMKDLSLEELDKIWNSNKEKENFN